MSALSTAPASGLLAVPDRPITLADARLQAVQKVTRTEVMRK